MEKVSLRDYVGKTFNACYEPRLYVLDGDLAGATRSEHFRNEHPDHFIECGISETSATSIATGLAMEGMIPFFVDFAIFCAGSAWTQVRMACYANANLKMLATHPGIDNGPDGATHHGNEDITLLRVLPNMHIYIPQSPAELEAAVRLAMQTNGPCYIRVGRDSTPLLPEADKPFGGLCIRENTGDDFAIVYEGTALSAAWDGWEKLTAAGHKGRLIQIQTIKPFPGKELLAAVDGVKKIISVENHSVIGGLGGAICETLAAEGCHAPVRFVGVQDCFTQSGTTGEIKARYGLTGDAVVKAFEA